MYIVYALEDHKAKIYVISGIDRLKKRVNGQKFNSLMVNLLDSIEKRDLKIDLADK